MTPRKATTTAQRLAKGFPVVAVTGPRQSGKATLAQDSFADKAYVSLENPDEHAFAEHDPRAFLNRFASGAILDEVQRRPHLLSWLQGLVDARGRMGDFVLTGSAQFDLIAGITQSLAGRVGRIELLPLMVDELAAAGKLPSTLEEFLLCGGYPALYDRELSPGDWFPNYVGTYLERDMRQLVARLPPYHRNFGKRLVKSHKLYFLDVGLMAWLLGIRDAASIQTHAARGALFETYVVSECIKQRFNAGQGADLFFWRDNAGHAVDLLFDTPQGMQAVEIKSGSTFASDWPDAIRRWQKFATDAAPTPVIVYGGEGAYERQGCRVIGWRGLRALVV